VETTSGSYPSLSKKNDDKLSLCNFNTLANNTQMNKDANVYAKFYEGIERANLAIEGIRTYGDIEKNPDMAHLLGEALTMRAVIYNDLIKAWGAHTTAADTCADTAMPTRNRQRCWRSAGSTTPGLRF
jgi:hypothetical protein